MCVTNEIIEEYLEIIEQKTNANIASNVVSVILSQKNVEFVTPYYKLHLIHADEDDNKFVDCAFAAGASCIVSNDAHFKTLNEIKFPRIFVINIKEFVELLLRNQGNNQLHNLLLDTVEEGEVYRLCLTKEGIIPKNKGDEGRKKFFVVVGKDQEGNCTTSRRLIVRF